MHKSPKILDTKVVAQSRLFRIESCRLRFASGVERDYERILGYPHGAVMVVPFLDDESVLLIREYEVGVEDYVLTLPKGLIEPDEDVLTAANRELKEEVGYGAHELRPMKRLATSSGFLVSHVDLVLACDLYEERLPGDEPEELEVVPWRLSEFDALLKRDDFVDPRALAALFLAREGYGK